MTRGPPRSTLSSSSAASDVYKRQTLKGLVRTKQRLSASISESDGVRLQLLRALDFISHVNSTPYSPIHMTALGETLKQLASVSKGSIEIKWLLCKIIVALSLIHISEPTRLLSISYAVFCLKKTNS
eukprot:TRINITY_DN33387_c0_g1_i1.p1 TRINITY_DN33387_c0_g1~~TRINITY_DN33387_c0_g1_i1.p1  ORF type:complete len:127 (+),score=15.25 TRINITY_DN33387_c0_g1_i1:64-444(+)